MSSLIHIPARAGSKGLPGKNLRTVGGLSLVAWAVRVGRAWLETSGSPGDVFVDTDGEAIAEEARRHGALVPFLRSAQLAGDGVSSVDTVVGALDRFAASGRTWDSLVLLQPTSPLREVDDVARCVEAHRAEGSALTVAPLGHPVERTLEVDAAGHLSPLFGADAVAAPRQAHRERVVPNGAVYAIHIELLRRERRFLIPGVTRAVPMPLGRSIDIDHQHELDAAETFLERRWRARQPRPVLAPPDLVLHRAPFEVPTLVSGALVAPSDHAGFERVRTLACGLGLPLAFELSEPHAARLGVAVARGVSVVVTPAAHRAAVATMLADVVSLTHGP